MHILPETKRCLCGMRMILRDTDTLITYSDSHAAPRIVQEWYCGGCGAHETGPSYERPPERDPDMDAWRQANGLEPLITPY